MPVAVEAFSFNFYNSAPITAVAEAARALTPTPALVPAAPAVASSKLERPKVKNPFVDVAPKSAVGLVTKVVSAIIIYI